MLIAHKVIDALLGRDKKYQLMDVPGLPSKEEQATVADLISRAQKFDFGNLHLEQRTDGSFMLPQLTEEEKGFWRDGLIPLPYPVCWYEWTLGHSRSGLLVMEDADKFCVQRIDLGKDDKVLLDGMISQVNKRDTDVVSWKIELLGNEALIKAISRETLLQWMAANAPLAIYLTLMINSKSTEITEEQPPPKLNVARQKRGTTPLAMHRVVHIIPKHYLHTRGADGIDRRSPRLHWRRSHLRHLPSGKAIVIARMLVGKAELGEVSHEYKIG